MKMRKFERGGFATSEDSDYNRDSLGDFIVKKDVDRVPINEVAADEKVVTDDRIARTSPAAASKAKPAIVTLQQLNAFKAKYGADKDLTDYMNDQAGGLKRKNAPPPKIRETTVEDVFPVLTGEKKRAEEKMDKKQFRAEQNAQIIAREAAKAKAKAKESETRTPKRSGNLTDMLGLSSRYASGGSVSASSRGDGIAQRGKTRGKMC